MIIVKIFNQQLVQVTTAGYQQPTRQLLSAILASKNSKQINGLFARSLVQSSAQSQKITNSNNQQQLIPVARNISFRQCQHPERRQNGSGQNAKASFSISASSPQAHFISADSIDQFISIEHEDSATRQKQQEQQRQQRESPLEILKRHAKDVREKPSGTKSRYYGQSFNEAMASTTGESSERSLVVLLSWLEAKEKHIEKYRQFYLDRGYDVLNVKTSPMDLLLPNVGARKISEDFLHFMIEKQYSNVVVHGFSVGGYMFGRFLVEIEKHDAETRDKLINSIRGIVFDSLVPFEGICPGVAKSVTSNPFGIKVMEKLLSLYLKYAQSIATKHYLEVSDKMWSGPLRCPTLFLMSKDDNISDFKIVERLASVWTKLGIECRKMLVESSPHVQLYSRHHERYVEQVDDFLRHIEAPSKSKQNQE